VSKVPQVIQRVRPKKSKPVGFAPIVGGKNIDLIPPANGELAVFAHWCFCPHVAVHRKVFCFRSFLADGLGQWDTEKDRRVATSRRAVLAAPAIVAVVTTSKVLSLGGFVRASRPEPAQRRAATPGVG